MTAASYFALFNLEPRFALPLEQLERAYLSLAAQVHPDRHTHAGEAAVANAMLQASRANEAYQTLKQPICRARHLLELRGVDMHGKQPALQPAFLMEQMEYREALVEARAACDSRALEQLERSVKHELNTLIARLQAQLDSVDGGADPAAAQQTVQQLMFVEKLFHEIGEAFIAVES